MVNSRIEQEYEDLIKSIEVLFEDVTDKNNLAIDELKNIKDYQNQLAELYQENTKIPEEEKKIAYKNFQKTKDISRSLELEYNSKFVYAFALFERFQSVVIDEICKDESSKYSDRYKRKFLEKAKYELKNLDNHELINSIQDFKKTLGYKSKVDNLLKLCRDLLDIKQISGFEINLVYYQEARERRNLLIHRGTKKDEKYEKSIFEHTKKMEKSRLEVMKAIEKMDFKNNSKNVSDRYFSNALSVIYYFSAIIYFHTFELTNEQIKKNDPIFPDFQHSLMITSINKPSLLFRLLRVWQAYYETKAKKSFANFPDYEKINFCLLLNYLDVKTSNSGFSEKIKAILDSISSERQLEKELITSVISNEHNLILSNLKKFLSKSGNTKDEIRSWFMMQELLANEDFKAKFERLKIN